MEAKSSQRSCLGLLLDRTVACGTVFVAALTIGGFAARSWWRFEQMCHFRLQYFWLLAAAAITLLILKRPRWACFAAVLAAVNVAMVLPVYWPRNEEIESGRPLSLVSYNVLSSNQHYAEVSDFLRSEDADVVLLLEVNPQWAARLDNLSNDYPHRHVVAREDNFGIALLSRRPWREIETRTFGEADLPSIAARYDLGSSPLTIIGSHPLPPGDSGMAAHRNEQLADLARFAAQQLGIVILVGDLNVTSYSPYFHDLLRKAKLRDSRQGFGVQASWSARIPGLDIAIDHCLVSEGVAVVERCVGPSLGSDHRPVIVRLLLR